MPSSKRSLNILQVIPYFVPAWDYGGPVRVCYGLSRQLVKRGHKVTVYTTDALNASSRVTETQETVDGIRVRRFRNLSNTLAHRHHIFLTMGMIQPMRELGDYDVIHLHEYYTLQNALIRYRAIKLGVPYLLQAHGSLPTTGDKKILKKLYANIWGSRLVGDATRLIALTTTEAGQYRAMGASESKVRVVPNGIALREFGNLPTRGAFRNKHGLNDDGTVVLYLGRIHQTKGLDLLVRAFARLAGAVGHAKLVIAGPDDGYLPELEQLVKDLGIQGRTLFTGPLYGQQKLEAYVDGDVFVTPAFHGFPITFIEACATGLPIVTTERGDQLDWIQDQVGYVTAYNEEELGTAVTRILSDTAVAERFRKRGQEITTERFNWARIATQVEHLYLECLGARGGYAQ